MPVGAGDVNVKYLRWRTEICKFHAKGQCTRGAACLFAHGPANRREVPDLSKTRMCKFVLRGLCQFGADCVFAHGHHELRGYDESSGFASFDGFASPTEVEQQQFSQQQEVSMPYQEESQHRPMPSQHQQQLLSIQDDSLEFRGHDQSDNIASVEGHVRMTSANQRCPQQQEGGLRLNAQHQDGNGSLQVPYRKTLQQRPTPSQHDRAQQLTPQARGGLLSRGCDQPKNSASIGGPIRMTNINPPKQRSGGQQQVSQHQAGNDSWLLSYSEEPQQPPMKSHHQQPQDLIFQSLQHVQHQPKVAFTPPRSRFRRLQNQRLHLPLQGSAAIAPEAARALQGQKAKSQRSTARAVSEVRCCAHSEDLPRDWPEHLRTKNTFLIVGETFEIASRACSEPPRCRNT